MKRADDVVAPPPAKRSKKGRGTYSRRRAEEDASRVAFLSADKAPQLSLSGDRLTVLGTTGGGGGYRMARASHGVSAGAWYWECAIGDAAAGDAHYRVGWATKRAPLQAPCGYDRWSYAYRDLAGSAVHSSDRIDGYGAAYGPGDVVGCLLVFGDDDVEDTFAETPAPDTSEHPTPDAPPCDVGATNYMRFFVNGVDQGVAFRKVPPGTYFPAVSVYRAGAATANFGPDFRGVASLETVALRDGGGAGAPERAAKPISALIPPPPPPPDAPAAP